MLFTYQNSISLASAIFVFIAVASCQLSSKAYLNSSGPNLLPSIETTACTACSIFLDVGPLGHGRALQQHFWWHTALSATLVTAQYNATRYNNTVISNSQTISHDYRYFYHSIRALSVPESSDLSSLNVFYSLSSVFGQQ